MVTKEKFKVENPQVVQLRNGKHAYMAVAPWKNPKTGNECVAYKFCANPNKQKSETRDR